MHIRQSRYSQGMRSDIEHCKAKSVSRVIENGYKEKGR